MNWRNKLSRTSTSNGTRVRRRWPAGRRSERDRVYEIRNPKSELEGWRKNARWYAKAESNQSFNDPGRGGRCNLNRLAERGRRARHAGGAGRPRGHQWPGDGAQLFTAPGTAPCDPVGD